MAIMEYTRFDPDKRFRKAEGLPGPLIGDPKILAEMNAKNQEAQSLPEKTSKGFFPIDQTTRTFLIAGGIILGLVLVSRMLEKKYGGSD